MHSRTKHILVMLVLMMMVILMMTILTVIVLTPSRLDIIMLIRDELILMTDLG